VLAALRQPRQPPRVRVVVAAPSANLFGRVSPTTAAHVQERNGRPDLLMLDGGPCPVGIESTIVDCSRAGQPVLLRPGAITPASSWQRPAARPAVLRPQDLAAAGRRRPGPPAHWASHYAPRARVSNTN